MLPPRNFAKRGRESRIRSEAHRRFVRSFMCMAYRSKECWGKVDCCHNRDESPEKGMGTKPSDLWCYPCCRKHHIEAEKREGQFGAKHGVNVYLLCIELAERSPDKMIREAAKQYRTKAAE